MGISFIVLSGYFGGAANNYKGTDLELGHTGHLVIQEWGPNCSLPECRFLRNERKKEREKEVPSPPSCQARWAAPPAPQPGKGKTALVPKAPGTGRFLGVGGAEVEQKKWKAGCGYFETTGPGQGPLWKSHLPFWDPSSGLELLSSSIEKGGKSQERRNSRRQWERDVRTQRNRMKERHRPRNTEVRDNTKTGKTGLAPAWQHLASSVWHLWAQTPAWPLAPGPWPLCPSLQEGG